VQRHTKLQQYQACKLMLPKSSWQHTYALLAPSAPQPKLFCASLIPCLGGSAGTTWSPAWKGSPRFPPRCSRHRQ